MNVTFIIGNGFDIKLNLPTRYEDFYKNYLVKQYDSSRANKNIIFEQLIDDQESNDSQRIELWKDLELALGAITNKFNKEKIEEYIDSIFEINDYLHDYLKRIDDSVNFDDFDKEIIKEELNLTIQNLLYSGKVLFDQKIKNQFSVNSNSDTEYNFITFNYTFMLERIFDKLSLKDNIISTHKGSTGQKNDLLAQILHIHGTLDNQMILGVDGQSQILNPVYANDIRIKELLIKRKANQLQRNDRMDRFNKIINKSDIICIYGCSLGETDSIYWYKLVEWLKESSSRHLIIHQYDSSYSTYNTSKNNFKIQGLKRKFIRYYSSNLNEAIMNNLMDRMEVYSNANVFNFDFIKNQNIKENLKWEEKK